MDVSPVLSPLLLLYQTVLFKELKVIVIFVETLLETLRKSVTMGIQVTEKAVRLTVCL